MDVDPPPPSLSKPPSPAPEPPAPAPGDVAAAPTPPAPAEPLDPPRPPLPDDPPKISHERGKTPPGDLEQVTSGSRAPSPKPAPVAKQATPVPAPPAEATPAQSRRATPMAVDDPPRTRSTRSRRPSPIPPAEGSPHDRPLNVTDALTYLDQVKLQFNTQPDVYNQFLDIMKEFKNDKIDTPGVIERVSHLFHGHPDLIQGFNTFLPAGYRIECSTGTYNSNVITVTTPSGTMHSTQNGTNQGQMRWTQGNGVPTPRPEAPLPEYATTTTTGLRGRHPHPTDELAAVPYIMGQAIEPAVQYVQKIKASCDTETYRQFLGILTRYHHSTESIDEAEVSRQISRLFKDAPDLANDFRVFMPDKSFEGGQQPRTMTPTLEAVAPLKRKRKNVDKEREREKEIMATRSSAGSVPPSKKSKHANQDASGVSYNPRHIVAGPSQGIPPQAQTSHPSMPADDSNFFEHVKRHLENRDLYNEFLKVVNLFTQEYIDMATLVKESRHFLGDSELYKQFKDILGWDERRDRQHNLAAQQSAEMQKAKVVSFVERPGKVDYFEKFGSYRKIPGEEANVPCSGRDEMCRSVLNDDWVCHPTWTSEDSGFVAHKKNIYEEALHRSEEERHEYDFHIEAITRTIAILEPITIKIAQMNIDDRTTFKLKPNLGGAWKAIHQRVIKKIYGREAGLEVIHSMQDTPALAIPVVLGRLKQKEEEWKRAQREWNKVWREVDARNFAKSLDHQAITFKTADKRAITTKALVSQIEAAREEQMGARASLIDPLFARTRPRHQLDFVVDLSVLQDALKLTFSFMDRTQTQVSFADRRKLEASMRSFIPLFFTLDPVAFNAAFSLPDANLLESEGSESDSASVGADVDLPILSIPINYFPLPPPPPPPKINPRAAPANRKGVLAASSASLLANAGGDLRKKLLKAEQAKSSRKTRAQNGSSPATSRPQSPALLEEELVPEVIPVDLADGIREARQNPRRYIFFTNTTFYVLVRLILLLTSRLAEFKDLSAKIAAQDPKTRRPNPGSSIAPPAAHHILSMPNPSKTHFYQHLLDSVEALYNNEIEQHAFEDQMRAVFGIQHAYKIFTADKVCGAIVKQLQSMQLDHKSHELLEILKKERSLVSPTTQDQKNTRRSTEKVLGPDENMFRIDWLADTKTITIQLIGKDDSSFDDSEVLTGRWQSYIDSFVSADVTSGVSPSKMKLPFLKRNVPASAKQAQPDVASRSNLEIKVCVRTYRFFYVTNTEDFLWKYRSKAEMESSFKRLKKSAELRQEWMKKIEQEPVIPAVAPRPVPAAPAEAEKAAVPAPSAPAAVTVPS